MSRELLHQFQAERAALQRMISDMSEDDVIDLGSLTTRLSDVEKELSYISSRRLPAHATLTFSGKPVVGSHGIVADFGMRAISAFSDAVSAVAASLTAPLRAMGPIPNKDQNQLLIINKAIGSFGFELEELMPTPSMDLEYSVVEQALERTKGLLSATIETDDDILAEAASEIDPRALDKIRLFVTTLADNEALCALNFKGKEFRFSNSAQVQRSIERISEENLQEDEETIIGFFEGVLPNKRKSFEFRMLESSDVIVGKISASVPTPEEINQHIKQKCQIKVTVTRAGQGRPRYLLIETPSWFDVEK